MKVLIVGLNHGLQLSAILTENVNSRQAGIERQQKEQFKQRLLEIIKQHSVQFVGEEMDDASKIPKCQKWMQSVYDDQREKGRNPIALPPRIEVIGHQVAKMCRIIYAEVDIPVAERAQRGIPEDYEDDQKHSLEEIARCYRVREEYMFRQTMANAGEAQSVLVICGRKHMEGLAKLFRNSSCTVEGLDLTREAWYIADWNAG